MKTGASGRAVERICWSLAVLAALAAALGWRLAAPAPDAETPSVMGRSAELHPAERDSVAAAAERVIASNPFRLDRRPADVAYKPELEGAPPPPPSPPKPALRLAGILGGPPWQAVIEGIPGRDGSVVVRSGDVFDRLRIRIVTRDTVVVVAPDTTWRLTVRRPW